MQIDIMKLIGPYFKVFVATIPKGIKIAMLTLVFLNINAIL
jgi:hypothetical protein